MSTHLLIVLTFCLFGAGFVIELALAIRGALQPGKLVSFTVMPVLFCAAAHTAGTYPHSQPVVRGLMFVALVVTAVTLLAHLLQAWIQRESKEHRERRYKAAQWPPPGVLKPSVGFVAQPQQVTMPELYASCRRFPIGDVNETLAESFAGFVLNQLKSGKSRRVILEFNSGGGFNRHADNLAERIRLFSGQRDVYGVVMGDCMSAAVTVFTALPVERRFATADSRFMIHRAQYPERAHLERRATTRKQLIGLQIDDNMILDRLARATGVTLDSLRKVFTSPNDVYLTAQQALQLGIIGGIIET